MRWLYLAVVVLFAGAVLVFAAQNVAATTVTFLRMSIQVPLALLIVVAYLLGGFTGGSLLALMRKSVQGARRREPAASS
jgi:lipopolysaccharide assembly protein A